jgi:hypothetical protein
MTDFEDDFCDQTQTRNLTSNSTWFSEYFNAVSITTTSLCLSMLQETLHVTLHVSLHLILNITFHQQHQLKSAMNIEIQLNINYPHKAKTHIPMQIFTGRGGMLSRRTNYKTNYRSNKLFTMIGRSQIQTHATYRHRAEPNRDD